MLKFELILFTNETKSLFKTTKLLDILKHFKSLTECKIKSLNLNDLKLPDNSSAMDETIGSFDDKPIDNKNLTKLELQISNFDSRHLTSIHLCLPHLKSVVLSSDQILSDKCLKNLSKLQQMRHLEIKGFNCVLNPITNSGIQRIIKKCPKIETIFLKINTKITEKSIKNFIELANKRPKTLFKLIFVSKTNLSIDYSFYKYKNIFIKDFTKEFYDKYNYY